MLTLNLAATDLEARIHNLIDQVKSLVDGVIERVAAETM